MADPQNSAIPIRRGKSKLTVSDNHNDGVELEIAKSFRSSSNCIVTVCFNFNFSFQHVIFLHVVQKFLPKKGRKSFLFPRIPQVCTIVGQVRPLGLSHWRT